MTISLRNPIPMLCLFLCCTGFAAAAEFTPPLDQTREAIVGTGELRTTLPADATSATLPTGRRNVLTEIPGRPFRQVDPPPQTVTLWKVPFYAALGLPRDLVDGFMGLLAYVPIISNIDYVVYELVPTQAVMRDPHDWHRWDGGPNKNGHAFYKGEWGWFPTAHAWKLKEPNARLAKKNEAYNAKLQKELDQMNSAAEAANQQAAATQREARQAALEALLSGKATDPTGAAAGRAATERMLPIYQAAQLDEGAFALLTASLATYENSPREFEDLLWSELLNAPPARLQPARRLLQEMTRAYPLNARLQRALILTDMLLGEPDEALKTARDYADPEAGRPLRNRLVFETALAAGKTDDARAALDTMLGAKQFPDQWPLMRERLYIAAGQLQAARKGLAEHIAGRPGDPYLNYYLGVTDLKIARQGAAGYEAALGAAQAELQRAALTDARFLRDAAAQALALTNQIKAELAQRPSLAENAARTPAAAQKNPLKPKKPAKEKKKPSPSPLNLDVK